MYINLETKVDDAVGNFFYNLRKWYHGKKLENIRAENISARRYVYIHIDYFLKNDMFLYFRLIPKIDRNDMHAGGSTGSHIICSGRPHVDVYFFWTKIIINLDRLMEPLIILERSKLAAKPIIMQPGVINPY